jgi:hypothetical protein
MNLIISAIQETPFLKNSKFHPHISKFSPPVHVLNQIEDSQSYSSEINFNIFHSADPYKLHTFHVPNLMSSSLSLHRSKRSVQVRGFVKCLVRCKNCSKMLQCWVVSNSPNQQTGGYPLSDVRYCLFSILPTILHIWWPPPSQPEGRPHHDEKNALSTPDDTLQLWWYVLPSPSIFSSINSITQEIHSSTRSYVYY